MRYVLGNTKPKAIHKQAKFNICVCSLKREVKVKVKKLCARLEGLINVYKLIKFDCIINGLSGTQLNAHARIQRGDRGCGPPLRFVRGGV